MPKIINIDCFEITTPDGGGMRSDHVMFVDSKSLADRIVNESTGWPRYSHEFKKRFVIFQSMMDIEEYRKVQAKEEALAKLTEADKIALGLA